MSDDPTNTQRAAWAHKGLAAFAKETGQRLPADEADAIQDLLTDLMHLCRLACIKGEEINFDDLLTLARGHYDTEVIEDEDFSDD